MLRLRASLLIFLLVVAAARRPRRRNWEDDGEVEGGDTRRAIPGTPGEDYPTLNAVPRTSFSCYGKPGGFYADPETRCQVFHICTVQRGAMPQQSFLCPNGTVFSTRVNICDWWNKVHCDNVDPYQSGGSVTQASRKQYIEPVSTTDSSRSTTLGKYSDPLNSPDVRFRELSTEASGQDNSVVEVKFHRNKECKKMRGHKNNNGFWLGYTHNPLTNTLTTDLPLDSDDPSPENGLVSPSLPAELSGNSPVTEVSIKPRVRYTHSFTQTSASPIYSLNPILQVARDSSLLSTFESSPTVQTIESENSYDEGFSNNSRQPVQRYVADHVLPQYNNLAEVDARGDTTSPNGAPIQSGQENISLDGDEENLEMPSSQIFPNEGDDKNILNGKTNNVDNTNPVGNPEVDNSNPVGYPEVDNTNPVGNPEVDNTNPVGNPEVDNTNTLGNPEIDNTNPAGNPEVDNTNPVDTSDLFSSLLPANAGDEEIINSAFGNDGAIEPKPPDYDNTNSVNFNNNSNDNANINNSGTGIGSNVQNSVNAQNSVVSDTGISGDSMGLPARVPEPDDFSNQQSLFAKLPGATDNEQGTSLSKQFENMNKKQQDNQQPNQSGVHVSTDKNIKFINQFIVNVPDSYVGTLNPNSFGFPGTMYVTQRPSFHYLPPTTQRNTTRNFPGTSKDEENSAGPFNIPPTSLYNTLEEPENDTTRTPSTAYFPSTTEQNFPDSGKFKETGTVNPLATNPDDQLMESVPNESMKSSGIDFKVGEFANREAFENPYNTQYSRLGTNQQSYSFGVSPTVSSFQNQPLSYPNTNNLPGLPNSTAGGYYITEAPPRVNPVRFQSGMKFQQNIPFSNVDQPPYRVENNARLGPVEANYVISNQPSYPSSSSLPNPTGAPPVRLRPPTLAYSTPTVIPSPISTPFKSISPNYPSVRYKQKLPRRMLILARKPAFENSHIAFPAFPPQSIFYSPYPRQYVTPTPMSNEGSSAPSLLPAVTTTTSPSSVEEALTGNQNYEQIIKESIGTVGYTTTVFPVSPQAANSTTPSEPPFFNGATNQISSSNNEESTFPGSSSVSVPPNTEANTESATDGSSLSAQGQSGPSNSGTLTPPTNNLGISTKSTSAPIQGNSGLPTVGYPPADNSKQSNFAGQDVGLPSGLSVSDVRSTQFISGFSTPKPFQDYQRSYVPPLLHSTILPDYTRVGQQLFRPEDLFNINNLHRSTLPSTVRGVTYGEIVRSISFSFDNAEDRALFEQARSRGLFQR